MTVTKADLKQLAAQLRLAGELLESNGEEAWNTMQGWDAGPAASNTDTSRGNRVDEDQIPITITDPTGDAVVALLERTGISDLTIFKGLLDDIEAESGALVDLLRLATPHMPAADKQHLVEQGLIDDGWCISCHRDNDYFEPIPKKPDGTPYYRGLCRWCGEFKAKNKKQLPPLILLRAHHMHYRVSPSMAERALSGKRRKRRR